MPSENKSHPRPRAGSAFSRPVSPLGGLFPKEDPRTKC